MSLIVVPAFDASGAPLTGLSPSWHCLYNADTEVAYTPQPAIAEIGSSGVYKFTQPEGLDLAGIIDLGATALPRYMVYHADNFITFAAFDATPAPLAALSPVWNACKDVEGNDYAPQPTLIELGLGMYKVARHTGRAVGVIDATASATPRYIGYDSDDIRAIPVAVTPDEPIALSAVGEQIVEDDLPKDLELGTNGELIVEDGDLVLVSGVKAIRQAVLLSIMSFKGEWFADLDEGTPWYDDILGQKLVDTVVRGAIRDAILDVDEITGIQTLELEWNGVTREVTISFEAVAISGQLVSGTTTI